MICSLCHRELLSISTHHLIPRSLHKNKKIKKIFLRSQLHAILTLCLVCHKQIHAIFTEKELANKYYTLDNLKSNQAIDNFISWIKNKPIGFMPNIKKAKNNLCRKMRSSNSTIS